MEAAASYIYKYIKYGHGAAAVMPIRGNFDIGGSISGGAHSREQEKRERGSERESAHASQEGEQMTIETRVGEVFRCETRFGGRHGLYDHVSSGI